jgi:hypothetical protein
MLIGYWQGIDSETMCSICSSAVDLSRPQWIFLVLSGSASSSESRLTRSRSPFGFARIDQSTSLFSTVRNRMIALRCSLQIRIAASSLSFRTLPPPLIIASSVLLRKKNFLRITSFLRGLLVVDAFKLWMCQIHWIILFWVWMLFWVVFGLCMYARFPSPAL